jgi:hypothetical protein
MYELPSSGILFGHQRVGCVGIEGTFAPSDPEHYETLLASPSGALSYSRQ